MRSRSAYFARARRLGSRLEGVLAELARAPKPVRARVVPAGVAIVAVVAMATPGCDVVLDIPSDALLVEASSVKTCDCPALVTQRGSFASQCSEALGELFSNADPDEATREAQLGLGAMNCASCSAVEACYAELTDAQSTEASCGASEDCASWSCCAGQLQLAFVDDAGGRPDLVMVGTREPTCCEVTPPETVACKSCDDVIDGIADGVPVNACADAKNALQAIGACFSRELEQNPDLCPSCTTLISPELCAGCLLDDEGVNQACAKELQTCDAAVDRPIAFETEGG